MLGGRLSTGPGCPERLGGLLLAERHKAPARGPAHPALGALLERGFGEVTYTSPSLATTILTCCDKVKKKKKAIFMNYYDFIQQDFIQLRFNVMSISYSK